MALLANTTTTYALLAIASLILYRCGILLYRLFLHPLARVPGPKLAGLTSLYESYYDMIRGGQYAFKVQEWHKKYGPIIRIRPNEVHIRDPMFYDEVFSLKGHWDRNYDTGGLGIPNTIFLTMSHDLHRARRAPLAHFFSKQRIAALEPLIQRLVDKLLARMGDFAKSGKPMNVGAANSALTMDTIGAYALGIQINSLDQETLNERYEKVVEDMGPMFHWHRQFTWLPGLMNSIPVGILRGMNPGAAAWKDLQILSINRVATLKSQGATAPSKGNPDDHSSILHALLADPALHAAEKDTTRIGLEAMGLLAAGTSTTASTLTFIWFQLCKNPSVMAKLRKEVEDCPGPRPIPLQQLEQLPYLTGVVKEGLRLGFPSITRTGRISRDKTVVYSDGGGGESKSAKEYALPPGTLISMSLYFHHRDEDPFTDALAFNPDRWAKATEDRKRRMERFYTPFGKGTRACLGLTLAQAELYMNIAAVFGNSSGQANYELELYKSRDDDLDVVADRFLSDYKGKDGIKVLVKKI